MRQLIDEYLKINRDEVLRYLGYRNQVIDENILRLIDECIDETRYLAESRYVYKFFEIDNDNGKITLRNSKIELSGKNIFDHLKDSKVCILMSATTGSAIDMKIRYYEKINMTKALILDACASTAIEEVCDNAGSEIKEKLINQNKTITSRFSPGYGDLPMDLQRQFILVLEAGKAIGLTASSSNILIPRKSVTAIMGIIDKNDKVEEKSCLKCNKYSSCHFRRERNCCGN